VHKSYLARSNDDELDVEESMDLLIISVSIKYLPLFSILKSETNQYMQLAALLQSGQMEGANLHLA